MCFYELTLKIDWSKYGSNEKFLGKIKKKLHLQPERDNVKL